MKNILNSKLKVRVVEYKSKEEMERHIKRMKKRGWSCGFSGRCNLSPEFTIDSHLNDSNWFFIAEYYKRKDNKTKRNISYHSDGYYFYVYNSNESR